MTMIFAWLKAKAFGAVAAMLALALAWQTARIEGWPLIGGGLKAQVAGLQGQIAARDLAQARAQSAALTARAAQAVAMDAQAAAHAVASQAIQTQIQTIIREVPHVLSPDRDPYLPWGAVRLLDAASSGASVGDAAARVAPGQPDDAASDVRLSEAVALLATNAGAARQNADQLTHLQAAVAP